MSCADCAKGAERLALAASLSGIRGDVPIQAGSGEGSSGTKPEFR